MDIPIPQQDFGNIMVTYGFYTETGRAVYLNTVYIHQKQKDFNITLDKQVYNAGETVKASVVPGNQVFLKLILIISPQN